MAYIASDCSLIVRLKRDISSVIKSSLFISKTFSQIYHFFPANVLHYKNNPYLCSAK